jgi:hypothetical protein
MAQKRLDASTLEMIAPTICGGGGGSGASEYSVPGLCRSKPEILAFFPELMHQHTTFNGTGVRLRLVFVHKRRDSPGPNNGGRFISFASSS